MKTQTILFALLAVICLFTSSCDDEWDAIERELDCKRAKGSRVERELSLATFTGIELEIDANVFISLGSEQLVRVEGQSDLVDDLELEVRDGIWQVEFNRCYKSYDELDIYVTVTDLSELEVESSGYILAQTDFDVNDLTLRITGSGNIVMNDLTATKLTAAITGSGDIVLSGTSSSHDVYITGSGKVAAFGLEATNADVTIVGSGDAEVQVNADLDVGIAGSGSVFYKGNPSVSSSISGSGTVIKVN